MESEMPEHANPRKAIGLCLGASTISAVKIKVEGDVDGSTKRTVSPEGIEIEIVIRLAHEGNPRRALEQVLAELGEREPLDGIPVLATGRKFRALLAVSGLSEPEATEHALAFLARRGGPRFDALVSAGGETFIVYALDRDQKIAGLSTGNKCASGTGEFFLQQIRRMNLKLDEAVALALAGEPYAVSGRCSVFSKSDCTHALNKGEPIANVTAGLCRMVAKKILEIAAKFAHRKLCLVGGTALNRGVLRFLNEKLSDVVVPEEAPYFEALGAALAALERGRPLPEKIYREGTPGFSFLPPLKDALPLVTRGSLEYRTALPGDRCLLGLDVGSTTTKAVLVRSSDDALLASVYLRTNGDPLNASRACFASIRDKLAGTRVRIAGIGVTGSGRHIAGLYAGTEGVINEIIAHAAAAVYFDPEVDTIFEIGGQDAKYTHLTAGVASDYAMNEACSAGTGSFLEEAALESLGVKTEEIGDLALEAGRPPNFSDQCAAFISSDVKNAAHELIGRNDILAGLVYSICFNYSNRVKGARPMGRKIFMQGGVCYNKAVPLAMAAILQKPVHVPPEPGLMGAFGVALELGKRLALGLVAEIKFDLDEIVARPVTRESNFVCRGGREKCDLKCSIARLRVGDGLHSFGGACDRYYSARARETDAETSVDYVKINHELVFGKYAPPRPAKEGAPSIGISTSFLSQSLFPLYYNFFSLLGARVVLPDAVAEGASDHLVTSMCYPAEIAIGLFKNLIAKKPDYVFLPFAKELFVPNGLKKDDYCSTCGFSRGEGFYIRQAFKREPGLPPLLTPYLNFNAGWEKGRKALVKLAVGLGFAEAEAGKACDTAVALQYSYEEECRLIGAQALEKLEEEAKADDDAFAVVLFGRAYNAFAAEANKGIPKKFSSRGRTVIPFHFLPWQDEPLPEDYRRTMHWEAGQRLVRAAAWVARRPRLFGVFVTNFLCAPDSFIVPYFRKLMGARPSLTLELDAHTADAGLNTRIDAFLDVVHNYRRVQGDVRAASGDFRPARVSFEHTGAFFIDSTGRRHPFTDPRVKILLPSIGRYGSHALAAVFRGLGMRSEALPASDAETLKLGRSVTTGKECMPLIVCIGGLLKYLRDEKPKHPGEKLMLFLPEAAGHCRLGQYHVFLNQLLRDRRIADVAPLNLSLDGKFAGMGVRVLFNAWKAVLVADVMDDVYCSVLALARDRTEGVRVFEEEFAKICAALEKRGRAFYRQVRSSAARLRSLPLVMPYGEAARIAVTGEFYVRRDSFSNLGLAHRLARAGFLVSTAPLAEVMYYMSFMIKRGIKNPAQTLMGRIEFVVSEWTQVWVERKIKRLFARSGLYEFEPIDIDDLMRYSVAVPPELDGEPGIISAITFRDALTKYAGVVNVGPFGCMQTRFGDAVTAPQADMAGKREAFAAAGAPLDLPGFGEDDRIPFLTVESDGTPYPQLLEARFESFLLQAKRAAAKQGKAVAERATDDTDENR
jgi:predicted CoA-substrate-specific enzyme activase